MFWSPPPPHVSAPGHPPQLTVRSIPQASIAVVAPHESARRQKSASVSVQPQTFATSDPPQVRGAVQVPQLNVRVMPQVGSSASSDPQFLFKDAHTSESEAPGHAQTLAVPPAPHSSGAAQVPQSALLASPQLSMPQRGSHVALNLAQNAASVSGWQLVASGFVPWSCPPSTALESTPSVSRTQIPSTHECAGRTSSALHWTS